MNSPIMKALALAGSQSALARLVGVTQGAVNKWVRGGGVDPVNALRIEAATGGVVSKSDLRPDLWPPQETQDRGQGAA